MEGYIFNCLLDDENTIISVGFILREEFLEKALFHPKGEKVDFNNFIFPYDAYDVSVKELRDIQYLFDLKKSNITILDEWL